MFLITSQTDFTLDEFVTRMRALHSRLEPTLTEVGQSLPAGTTFTALTFNYSTLDEMGQPITMSSLMVVPMLGGTFSAPRMVLENRATQAADKSVPTRQWNIGTVHALSNSVLVSPDLMSFGASVARPVCYCCAALAVRNSVDAVIAAQQILQHELHLTEAPLPLYNTGHSQGGYDALALHRYLETQASEEELFYLPLVRSYCASGPYAPDVLTDVVGARGKYIYGAYMVLNAMSHLHYHAECFSPDVTIDDFLTPAAKELGLVERIAAKETSNAELVKLTTSAVGTRIDALFVPDAYLPEGRIAQMMQQASKKERQIDGWKPQKPIHFYHARYDECVPVECLYAALEAFADCKNITYEVDDTAPDMFVHRYSGGAFHRQRLIEGWK